MPILASEIKIYKSAVVSDLPANGGIMAAAEVTSGVSGNLFPNVGQAERLAGLTQFRKMFFKFANDADLEALNSRVWQDSNTVGDDRVVFFAATQRNTQSAITGAENKYGVGDLTLNAASGATSIQVTVEDGTQIIFRDGELIRISDRATPSSPGNEEWIRIDGVPSVLANVVTINLDTPLQNSYLSPGTHVSSVYEHGAVKATKTAAVVTSVSGTFTEGGANVIALDHIGGIEQTWTLTFTSGTAFNISGDTLGAVGAGSVLSASSPLNPSFAKPYFTIPAACWGGSFLAGDTVVFSTSPASIPLWVRRVVPAGAAAMSNNMAGFYVDAETV